MISLYKIAPSVWVPLIIGVLWCTLSSFIHILDFSNSGSVLVCCAIISQMYHSKWEYRDLRSSIPNFSEGIFELWLEHLSKSKELKSLSKDKDYTGDIWHPLMTSGRIDQFMEITIIIYLIIGTIIWGYGDNLELLFIGDLK